MHMASNAGGCICIAGTSVVNPEQESFATDSDHLVFAIEPFAITLHIPAALIFF